jgi:hypothetical protein
MKNAASEQPAIRASTLKPHGGQLGNSNRTTHGLVTWKRGKLRRLGLQAIDARSKLGTILRDLRGTIESDLGGTETLSRAQRILVDDVCRLTLWIDTVDGYLLKLPTIVIENDKALVPVVVERNRLVETRARLLGMLGLKRVPKAVQSLKEIIAQHDATKSEAAS